MINISFEYLENANQKSIHKNTLPCKFYPTFVSKYSHQKYIKYLKFMSPNQVELHRVFAAPVEKVFKAFSDPDAVASWLPPYGFTCKVHHMDFNIGGTYRMSFTNFTTGNGHSFGGEYIEIIHNETIKYTDQFDDPNLPGIMITTIQFRAVLCGTEIKATQTGIPDVIPTEMCYLGWQESLDKLKHLVEPNIPDA